MRLERLIQRYQGQRIHSIDELRPIIREIQELRIYYDHMEFYRGHGLEKYKLHSGLARYNKSTKKLKIIERCLFWNFSIFIKPKKNLVRTPFKKDKLNYKLRNKWYELFQAQHLGLKTRLMDWSISWEVALNFAVENEANFGQDGTLTVFFLPREYTYNVQRIENVMKSEEPFNIKADMMINTPIYMFDNELDFVGERRLSRQFGRFWMQNIDIIKTPLEEQEPYRNMILELIIDGNSKETIKNEFIASNTTIDWHYYRREKDVDESLKLINQINLEFNILQKLCGYIKLVYFYLKNKLNIL